MVDQPIVPVQRGDWLRRTYDDQIFKVRDIYVLCGEIIVDLYVFDYEGQKCGRRSPACGGPRSFEPGCTFRETEYERIAEPDWPVYRPIQHVPIADEPGTYVIRPVLHGVKALPFRSEPLKLKKKRKKPSVRLSPPKKDLTSNFDPLLEAASRRMSAQALRDVAKALTGDAAQQLREKATVLEKEAEAYSPR